MTDLAVPDQHSPAVPAQAAPTVQQSPFAVSSSIEAWAKEADLAYQLATRLATTSFIPSTMKGKVGDITACLLAGNELGLKPMAALKSMDVIQGTPALRAHAMRGLIQSRGHEVELVESAPDVCRMRGRRQGSDTWQEVVWTIARATLLGLTGKSEWKKQPQTMLVARATGEICRLIASDVLHAVPYTTEEMRDVEPKWTAVQVGAPVTAAEILGRQAAPAPEPGEQSTPVLSEHEQAVEDFYTAVEASGRDRSEVLEEFWSAAGCSPEDAATPVVRKAIDTISGAA
jgi:hypothetical protein